MLRKSRDDRGLHDLVALGMPEPEARSVARLLRADVTDRVCELLPNVVYSGSDDKLTQAAWVLSGEAPSIVRDMRSTYQERGIDQSPAASLAVEAVQQVAAELTQRSIKRSRRDKHVLGYLGTQGHSPQPHSHLTLYRRQIVDNISALHIPAERMSLLVSQLRTQVATVISLDRRAGMEWTGWALLAVMYVLGEQRSAITAWALGQGRGTPAGEAVQGAYETSRLVIVAAAHDLISNP